jgi:hypothetical protein
MLLIIRAGCRPAVTPTVKLRSVRRRVGVGSESLSDRSFATIAEM